MEQPFGKRTSGKINTKERQKTGKRENMKMNRVQLKAGTENVRSRAVAERLGFALEGIERDGELHSRGYIDLAVYSLLKKDF